ncbi:uncharacterized protein LOC127868147 [Dreissena polymorpha]|uniref:TASOR pseudo-PARP domain-containing protein n=1 Tax=Dreissena polymorpha TaxID=45954 RepID=A0A9D4M5A4_DREPO|nr:uncharacterized protein LOC127868147 [Dreissena polymorpha]KAH3870019.1 hypothetical protein DPMN_033198 [Dreissena polymorpha]
MSGKIAKKIPKLRKQESKDNLRHVDLTSRDCQEIVNSVKHTFLDSHYNPIWELKTASLVENRELQEKYRVKKSEMKEEGRKDLADHFTFQLHRDTKAVPEIVKSGMQCRTGNYNGLGDSKMGVYVWRNADVLMKIAESWGSNSCVLLIFKVMIGKCKTIAPPSGSDQPTIEPTPNFDSHIPVTMPRPSDNIGSQMAKSQIYLYEYDEDTCEPTSTPRQILPYAVLLYEKLQNQIAKPVSTKLDQYSIKPSERSLYRNVRAHTSRDGQAVNQKDAPSNEEIKESEPPVSVPPLVIETELCVPRLSDPRLTKKKMQTENVVSSPSSDVKDYEYSLCVPRLTSGPPVHREKPPVESGRAGSIPPNDPLSQLSYLTSGLKSSMYQPSFGPSDDEGDADETENNAMDINKFLKKPRMPSLPEINLPYMTDTRQMREIENEPHPVQRDPRLNRRHNEPPASRHVVNKSQNDKTAHMHRHTYHKNSSSSSEKSLKKLSLNDYKNKNKIIAQPYSEGPSTEDLVSPEPLAPHHASIIANPNICAVKYPHLRQLQQPDTESLHSDRGDESKHKKPENFNVIGRTSELNANGEKRNADQTFNTNEAGSRDLSVQYFDHISAIDMDLESGETDSAAVTLGNLRHDPRSSHYETPGSDSGYTNIGKNSSEMDPEKDLVEDLDDMAKTLNELSDPEDAESSMRVPSPEIDDPALAGAMQKLVEHSANVSLFTEALKSLQESAEKYGDKLKDPEFLVKKIAEKIEDLTREKEERERKEKEEAENVEADKMQEASNEAAQKDDDNKLQLLLEGFDENEDLDLRTLVSVSQSTSSTLDVPSGNIMSPGIMSPDIMSPDASNDTLYPDTPVKCIPLESTTETDDSAQSKDLKDSIKKSLEELKNVECAGNSDTNFSNTKHRRKKKSKFSDIDPGDMPFSPKVSLVDIPIPPITESCRNSAPTQENVESTASATLSPVDVRKPLPGSLGELVKQRQAKVAEKVSHSSLHISQSDSHLSSSHIRSSSRKSMQYDRSSSLERGIRDRRRDRFIVRGRHEDKHRYRERDSTRRKSNSPNSRDCSTTHRKVDDHKHDSLSIRNDIKREETKVDNNVVLERNSSDAKCNIDISANSITNHASENVQIAEKSKSSDDIGKMIPSPKGIKDRLYVADCFEGNEDEDIDLRSGFLRPKAVLPDLKAKLAKPKPQIKFSLLYNKPTAEYNQTLEKRRSPIKNVKVNVSEKSYQDYNRSSESKEHRVKDPFGLGIVEDIDERRKKFAPERDIDIKEEDKNSPEQILKKVTSEDNFQEVQMELDSDNDSADEVKSQVDYYDIDLRTTENSKENSQDSAGDYDFRKEHSRSHSRSKSPQSNALFDAYAQNKPDKSRVVTDMQYGDYDWRNKSLNTKENVPTLPISGNNAFSTMTSNSMSLGGLQSIMPGLDFANLKTILASVSQTTGGGFWNIGAYTGHEATGNFKENSKAIQKERLATIPGFGSDDDDDDEDEGTEGNNETKKIGGFWNRAKVDNENSTQKIDNKTSGGYGDPGSFVDHSLPEARIEKKENSPSEKDSMVRRNRKVKPILDMKSLFHSEVSRSNKLKANERLLTEVMTTKVKDTTASFTGETPSTPVRKKKYEGEDDFDDDPSTPLHNMSYHSALLESMEQSALKIRSEDSLLYDIPETPDQIDKDLESRNAQRKETTQNAERKRCLESALSSPPVQKQSKLDEDVLLEITDNHNDIEDEEDDDDKGLVIDSDADDDDEGLVIDLSPSNTVKSADSDQVDHSAVDPSNKTYDILDDSLNATFVNTDDMASALAKSRKNMVIKLKGDHKKVNTATGKMYNESNMGSAIEVLGQHLKRKQPAVDSTTSDKVSSETSGNLISSESRPKSVSSVQQTYGNSIHVLSKTSVSAGGNVMSTSVTSSNFPKTTVHVTSGNDAPIDMFTDAPMQYLRAFQSFVRPGLPPLLPYPQQHSGQEIKPVPVCKQQFGENHFTLTEHGQTHYSFTPNYGTTVVNSWTLHEPVSQMSTANTFTLRPEVSNNSKDPLNWFKDKVSPVSYPQKKIDASDPYNWFADKIGRRSGKKEDDKAAFGQVSSIKEEKMKEASPNSKNETLLTQSEKKKRVLKEIDVTHDPKKIKMDQDRVQEKMLLDASKLKRDVEDNKTKGSLEINKRVNEFGSKILETLSEVKNVIKTTKDQIRSANVTSGNCIVITPSSPSTSGTFSKNETTPSPVKTQKHTPLSKTEQNQKQYQTPEKSIKKEPKAEKKSKQSGEYIVLESEKEDGEISDDSDVEIIDAPPGKKNDTRIVRNRSGSDSSSHNKHGDYYNRKTIEDSPKRYVNVRKDYEFGKRNNNQEQRPGQLWSAILVSPETTSVERERIRNDKESELLRTVASIAKTKQKVQATSQVKTLEEWLKVELETDSISHLQDIIPFPLDMDLSQMTKVKRRKLKSRVRNIIQEEGKKHSVGTAAMPSGGWTNDNMLNFQPHTSFGTSQGRNAPPPWNIEHQKVHTGGNQHSWGAPASVNDEDASSAGDIRHVTVSQVHGRPLLESSTQESKGIKPHYYPEVPSDQLQKELKLIQETLTVLNARVNQMHSNFVNLTATESSELRMKILNDKKKILSMISVESEIRMLQNRTSFHGYPHRRVPTELLLSTELGTFRSPVEDVFLILMMPISPKPYAKLLQLKQEFEDLFAQKSKIAVGDATTLIKLDAAIKSLHDQRQAVLRSFTGYLNKKRIQKIHETVEKYTTVYEHFKSMVPPTQESMLKYVRTTQMDLRQHLILAKQYMAMEESKIH